MSAARLECFVHRGEGGGKDNALPVGGLTSVAPGFAVHSIECHAPLRKSPRRIMAIRELGERTPHGLSAQNINARNPTHFIPLRQAMPTGLSDRNRNVKRSYKALDRSKAGLGSDFPLERHTPLRRQFQTTLETSDLQLWIASGPTNA